MIEEFAFIILLTFLAVFAQNEIREFEEPGVSTFFFKNITKFQSRKLEE